MTPLSETSVEEQFNNFNNELDLENQVLYDLNIKVNIHQSKLTLTPPEMTIDLGKFHDRVHHGNKHSLNHNYDEFSSQTTRQRHHQVKATEIHLPGLQMNLKYFLPIRKNFGRKTATTISKINRDHLLLMKLALLN